MSAFTHLGHAVLGGRYSDDALFPMMTGYFDESIERWIPRGDSVPREFTFVCGYVASVERWQGFEAEWRQYLDRYEVSDFHMTDYCHCVGEFKKWRGDQFVSTRTAFIQEAAVIIRKFVRYGFVSILSSNIFKDVNREYQLDECFGSPYGVVGRACADLAWLRRANFYPGDSDLEFVFEDGGPDKSGLMKAMTGLEPAFSDPIFRPGKSQKPSRKYPEGRKAVLQLQAADYLAYEMRKLFADQIKDGIPKRDVRRSFEALTSVPTARDVFTVKTLTAMCEGAKLARRN